MNRRTADLLIVAVAMAWGISYVFMKVGLQRIPPFQILAMRFLFAFFATAIMFAPQLRHCTRQTRIYGLMTGIALFCAYASLSFGMTRTNASAAGFLASVQVLFVIMIRAFFQKHPPHRQEWIALLLLLIGLACMTLRQGFYPDPYSLLCLGCSLFYAIQILLTEHYAPQVQSIPFGVIQLGSAGFLSLAGSALFEECSLHLRATDWATVCVLAMVCTAFSTITLAVAQRHTSSVRTGFILTLEPVFSCIYAYCFLQERLSPSEVVGALLILLGILVCIIPHNTKKI